MGLNSVANWIIEEWLYFSQIPPSELENLPPILEDIENTINTIIHDSKIEPSELILKIKNFCDSEANPKYKLTKKLNLLQAIDSAFQFIHSRNPDSDIRAADWVRQFQAHRTRFGEFGSTETHRLIENGPLSGVARDEDYKGAASFRLKFTTLSVVNIKYESDTRPFLIDIVNVVSETKSGIFSKAKIDISKVGFYPLSTLKSDFVAEVTSDANDKQFVSFKNTANIIENFSKGLNNSPNCHIGISPEYSIAEDQLSEFCDSYIKLENTPLLYLAGTGNSTKIEEHTKLPWNEARVLNRTGKILWTQKKNWRAKINKDRFESYNIGSKANSVTEANAESNTFVMAEIANFGRCLILICQDIVIEPIISQILNEYQPDWVFVPILDFQKFTGRWADQYIHRLNHIGPTKFLVSYCCLQDVGFTDEIECGAFVGPHQITGEISSTNISRRFAIATTNHKAQSCVLDYADDSKVSPWKTWDYPRN